MNHVYHTCDVVYGSYSETIRIRCDADDDLEQVKSRIKKELDLNFLPMATYSVKILKTEDCDESC